MAIYSVSLLFSLLCNLAVLYTLGQPDVGLFLGTYFGYWMVGLAMLAIGMVASFLTGNLTVAFILGVAFNAPLVFLNVVDAIVRGSDWTANRQRLEHRRADDRFRPRRDQPFVDRLLSDDRGGDACTCAWCSSDGGTGWAGAAAKRWGHITWCGHWRWSPWPWE